MQKGMSDGPARSGQLRRFMRASGKRTIAIITLLSLLAIGLVLASCGGSDGGSSQGGSSQNISSSAVSGVAAGGAPLAGQVTLKDSATPSLQRVTAIGSDGSFALDVTGMKAPFVLEAAGSVNGVSYTLVSFANGPGTANINPLSNVAMAYAAKVNDPLQIYNNPDPATLDKVNSGLPQAVADLLAKLKPLLQNYGADTTNPITSHYVANHAGLDGFFDDVKFTLANGTLTMTNAKTGAAIFTCAVTNIMGGQFTTGSSPPPNPGSAPAAPTGVTATGGAGQVSVSWAAVSGATSYNIYWSAASGVTPTNGTKIAGATSPYVQAGLAPSTTYHFIVTAVNSAGESAASVEASATTTTAAPPPPTIPAAPTGVSAVGGANQVTVSWSAVSGATSYNIYWLNASGVATNNGTKVAGVTSPYVQTGLAAGTAYYFIVTAVNSAGESPSSAQVTATTTASAPPPPPPPPPPAFDALTFYNASGNCASCHGAPSSFTGGRTAAQVQAAINSNLGGMGKFSTMTSAQVAAIAAILGP